MSNDLTPDKLEEMILEELQTLEENINVKIVSGGKNIAAPTVKTDLGFDTTKDYTGSIKDIRNIAGYDGDGSSLTDDDFEVGYSTQAAHTKHQAYKSKAAANKKAGLKTPIKTVNSVYAASTPGTKAKLKNIQAIARGGGGGGGGGGGNTAKAAAKKISDQWEATKKGKTFWRDEIKKIIASHTSKNPKYVIAGHLIQSFADFHYGGDDTKGFVKSCVTELQRAQGGTQTPQQAANNIGNIIDKFDKVTLSSDYEGQTMARSKRSDQVTGVPYSMTKTTSTTLPGDFKKIQTYGAIDKSFANVLETFYAAAKREYGGSDTLDARLKALEAFAKDVTGKKAGLKAFSAEELMSAATVMKTLATTFSANVDSDAGTPFESFLALLSGGGVVGGQSGAVDIIAGGKGEVFLSAKQHKDHPAAEQAIGGWGRDKNGNKNKPNFIAAYDNQRDIGLGAQAVQAAEKGQAIWYIALAKKDYSGGMIPATLDLHIVGVKAKSYDWTGVTLQFMDAKATVHHTEKWNWSTVNSRGQYSKAVSTATNSAKDANMFQGGGKKSKFLHTRIPLLNTNQAIKNIEEIDKAIAAGLAKYQNDLIIAVNAATDRINAMRTDLTEGGATTGPDSITASVQVAKNYSELQSDLQDFLTEKGVTGTKVSKYGFNESKIQSLDDLIAETLRDIKIKRKK